MSSTYRRVGIVGARGTEYFDVRISQEGFEQWLSQRDELRTGPNPPPDRPPDVDTETLRAWIAHPGEEDHPYFVSHPVPSEDEAAVLAFPVLSVSWTGSQGRLRLFVLGFNDGGFEVAVEHILPPDAPPDAVAIRGGREYPKEMSPDAVWADIEHQVEQLSGLFANEPRVATYTEYVEFDAEMRLAKADIDRGFINPLPTEGVVQ